MKLKKASFFALKSKVCLPGTGWSCSSWPFSSSWACPRPRSRWPPTETHESRTWLFAASSGQKTRVCSTPDLQAQTAATWKRRRREENKKEEDERNEKKEEEKVKFRGFFLGKRKEKKVYLDHSEQLRVNQGHLLSHQGHWEGLQRLKARVLGLSRKKKSIQQQITRRKEKKRMMTWRTLKAEGCLGPG